MAITLASPHPDAALHEHHGALAEWIATIGGFDPDRSECDHCRDTRGPFTATTGHEASGVCLLCAAEIKGSEDGERETVETVLEALGRTRRA